MICKVRPCLIYPDIMVIKINDKYSAHLPTIHVSPFTICGQKHSFHQILRFIQLTQENSNLSYPTCNLPYKRERLWN
jgi:hypothetical protein